MSFENKSVSRRQALTGAAVLTAASVASCSQSSVKEATPAKKDLILDYKNPKWNRDALARIHGFIICDKISGSGRYFGIECWRLYRR